MLLLYFVFRAILVKRSLMLTRCVCVREREIDVCLFVSPVMYRWFPSLPLLLSTNNQGVFKTHTTVLARSVCGCREVSANLIRLSSREKETLMWCTFFAISKLKRKKLFLSQLSCACIFSFVFSLYWKEDGCYLVICFHSSVCVCVQFGQRSITTLYIYMGLVENVEKENIEKENVERNIREGKCRKGKRRKGKCRNRQLSRKGKRRIGKRRKGKRRKSQLIPSDVWYLLSFINLKWNRPENYRRWSHFICLISN